MLRTPWGVIAGILLLVACKQPSATAPSPASPPRRGPSVKATVLTIRTTLQPANRTTNHAVVIADSKARTTDEADEWRLYDLKAGTVTFVDDLQKTYRTQRFATLLARRRAVLRRPVDRELPAAQFESTGAQREILSIPATQSLIRLGGYQREVWFGKHPLIPDELFAMIHASAEPSTRLGAVVSKADEGLIAARGFPLIDRAEMPFGKQTMIVERTVAAIEQKDVPAAMLQIPDDYTEITEPVARRPRASSRPPGPAAPAAGSPPSSTTQTSP